MRIDRLHLLRYGAFEDRNVSFPDCPLVVVLGRNEAGKTTTLGAITELLFGIGNERGATHRNFRFDNRELRIGADISAPGGRLAFRRRKGNKDTLIAAEDGEAPLGDDALAPFLNGADRALFTELFGLSQETLRSGGARLVDGEGRIGESLLSAGGILRDAAKVGRELTERADALYARRKSEKRVFYAALSEFNAARAELKSATLHLPRLRQSEKHAARAEEDCEAARRRLTELSEADRLDARLLAALPVLNRLRLRREELVDYADLDEIEARRARRLIDADAAVATAREAFEKARAARVEAARALDEVPPVSPATEHAAAIDDLCHRRGEIRRMRSDLPRRVTELDGFDAQLDRTARKLGLDREGFDRLQPSDLGLADAEGRFRDLRALRSEREALADRIRSAEARIAGLKPKAVDGLDPVPLRRRAARLTPPEELRSKLDGARSDAQAVAETAIRVRDALFPALADPDELAELAVPRRAEIAAAERQQQELAQERAHLAQDRKRLAERRETAEAALAGLSEAGVTASREQLDEARAAREGAWQAIRAVWIEGGSGDAPEAGDYEALVVRADGLADLRESSAEIRARRAEHLQALDDVARATEELERRATMLDDRQGELDRIWAALWTGLSGPPATPPEMRDWLENLAEARRLREQADALAATAERAACETEEALAEWRALAAGLDLPDDIHEAELADAVEERISSAESAAGARATLEAERRALSEETERLTRNAEAIAAAEGRLWAALGGIGLGRDTSDEVIETALRIWAEAPGIREGRQSLATRIEKMQAEIDAFDAQVAALGADAAEDLDAALGHLAEDLAEDRKNEALREDRTGRLVRAKTAEDNAGEAMANAQAAIERALEGVAPDQAADPAALAARLSRREELRRALDSERALLVEQGWADERAVTDALAGAGEETLKARQEVRRTGIADARGDLEQKVAALRDATTALEEMTRDAGADEARWRLRSAAVRMQDAAEEWARLRAAALLLGAAVRRYRDRNRDPLVTRAAELFRTLTVGEFADLVIELGDDDEERLFARRTSGEAVPISGLSESTADQLFLALRIAAIERHCATAGPLPFVADDLLASFDRERTAAGLDVLAELGGRTQTLLFTHHHAIAEAAGALGRRSQVVEL